MKEIARPSAIPRAHNAITSPALRLGIVNLYKQPIFVMTVDHHLPYIIPVVAGPLLANADIDFRQMLMNIILLNLNLLATADDPYHLRANVDIDFRQMLVNIILLNLNLLVKADDPYHPRANADIDFHQMLMNTIPLNHNFFVEADDPYHPRATQAVVGPLLGNTGTDSH